MQIKGLTLAAREEAAEEARRVIRLRFGKQPCHSDFTGGSTSKYPAWLTKLITVLLTIAVLAGFIISATHINNIGQTTIATSIDNPWSIKLVGIALVLISEVTALVILLVLPMVHDRVSRTVLYLGLAGATAVALIGNWQDGNPNDPFAYVVAFVPPLLVLSLGFVGKVQVLEAISNRHDSLVAFEVAKKEYDDLTAFPERSRDYLQTYATTLRDKLLDTNNVGRGKTERMAYLASLPPSGWRRLVSAEMGQDSWWADDSDEDLPAEDVVSLQPVRVCVECGVDISDKRADALFCSSACTKRSQRS
ncbi:MAG TPA: hypothetical protein ENI05_09385 [Porticoccus sp.]|nr:hypothetical protein [Porticoccus sp.]